MSWSASSARPLTPGSVLVATFPSVVRHHCEVPGWNPLAVPEEQPKPHQMRQARVFSIVQLPIGAWIFWQAWTEVWMPDGPLLGTLAIGAFTAFGLAVIAANIRQAWFVTYPPRGRPEIDQP